MKKSCIVCGNKLKFIEIVGEIKDMKINFCEEHAEYCDNCDKVSFGIL